MKISSLPAIENGKIPKVLFIGNGINKAFGEPSWSGLIEAVSTGLYDEEMKKIRRMPYPLQAIVVTDDCVDYGLQIIADKMMPKELVPEHSKMLAEFVTLPFDAVLTTNYSYEIERALMPDFDCKMRSSSKWRKSTHTGNKLEEQFGIFRYYKLPVGELSARAGGKASEITGEINDEINDRINDGAAYGKVSGINDVIAGGNASGLADKTRDAYIWHVHGEAARPDSMIFGHYYYGVLLSVIQQYSAKVLSRYERCRKRGEDFHPRSWIDYFLIGDVYVSGFGMNLSEMDVWWLINCKKRYFKDYGGIFYYEPEIDYPDKFNTKVLAKSYRVNIQKMNFDGDYKRFYYDTAEDLRGILH